MWHCWPSWPALPLINKIKIAIVRRSKQGIHFFGWSFRWSGCKTTSSAHMHTPSANDEAQIIGQAQTKAGRLFMEAIYSDENSISRHITLDPCYALKKDRLTRWTVLIYYKNPCIKIYKRWRSGLATWPTKAPSKKWMSCWLLPTIATYYSRRRY